MKSYLILDHITQLLANHGFDIKRNRQNTITVSPDVDELPYCEIIQINEKHVELILGPNFDDFANSAQDYSDLSCYENVKIQTLDDLYILMFILNTIKPYLN